MTLRTTRAVTASALALTAGVLGSAACRQVAGVHELPAASAVCASCAHAECAVEETSCRAEGATCEARIGCELGCDPDDLACRASCMASPVGDAIGAFDACAETTCASSCASECGDTLPIAPPSSASACAACVAQACCAEATACGIDADCRAGLECARAESFPDAVTTCSGARHPAGTASFTALTACVEGACGDACAYGADWACLGATKVPVVTADSIHGTLILVNAASQSQGVPGLAVRGCYLNDLTCSAPVTGTATTDAHGSVTLTLPTNDDLGRKGFLGYFEIVDPAGVYLTTLAVAAFAVTQDGFTQSLVVTPVADAKSLFQALGETYDPSTGSAILTAVDCADHPSAGATFQLDNGGDRTLVIYPTEGIPSLKTTRTDSTGTAIVGYIPPGPGLITTTNASGQVVSKSSYFTRANAVSVVLTPVNQ